MVIAAVIGRCTKGVQRKHGVDVVACLSQGALRQQHHLAFIRRVAYAAFVFFWFFCHVFFHVFSIKWISVAFPVSTEKIRADGVWLESSCFFVLFSKHLLTIYTLCSNCTSESRQAAVYVRFHALVLKIPRCHSRLYEHSCLCLFLVLQRL